MYICYIIDQNSMIYLYLGNTAKSKDVVQKMIDYCIH